MIAGAVEGMVVSPTNLTDAELAALRAIDGTRTQPPVPPEIHARLVELGLIERREWPNGPLWRTAGGNRRARAGA